MSTSYRCKPALPWKTLLDGLETVGLKIEQSAEDCDETHKVLSDPDSGHYLHASTGDGSDTAFERYGGNNAQYFIDKLEAAFGIRMVSEHDDDYWDVDMPELEPGESVEDPATGSIIFRFPEPPEQQKE